MQTRTMSSALLALFLAACGPAAQRPSPKPGDRDVLTAEQLEATHASNLYDAIRQARPNFLYEHGFMSLNSARAQVAVVYVDNVQMGQVEYLKSIPTGEVSEVRHIGAAEATTRWGTGHAGGVIAVVTKAAAARQAH